ncbi:MAG: type III-A CRISPR-associated protein Csm2 [Syntrophomonadaceae bacterium]|nr:type III-A CRISPR-associated protein Csm2 [Syntrophomonadaceae bacterium]
MSNTMKEAFEKAGYKSKSNNTMDPDKVKGNSQDSFFLDTDYPAQAEIVIMELKKFLGRKYGQFTTSKIRNILSRVSEIYNDVSLTQNEVLDQDIQNRIAYLKIRLVYECGREPDIIKPFVEKAKLLELLNAIGDSRKRFIDYAHYMEALVAYHRYYGGRDN